MVIDENIGMVVIFCVLFEELYVCVGVVVDWLIGNVGVLYCYGYLFFFEFMLYGFKCECWIESMLVCVCYLLLDVFDLWCEVFILFVWVMVVVFVFFVFFVVGMIQVVDGCEICLVLGVMCGLSVFVYVVVFYVGVVLLLIMMFFVVDVFIVFMDFWVVLCLCWNVVQFVFVLFCVVILCFCWLVEDEFYGGDWRLGFRGGQECVVVCDVVCGLCDQGVDVVELQGWVQMGDEEYSQLLVIEVEVCVMYVYFDMLFVVVFESWICFDVYVCCLELLIVVDLYLGGVDFVIGQVFVFQSQVCCWEIEFVFLVVIWDDCFDDCFEWWNVYVFLGVVME